jgi:O-antigen/teichoic acid export membrane protein
MSEEKLSVKIVRNTIYNIIGNFWTILVSIFLIPYIISHIGIERFGIWSLITVITGYLGLLDIGISRSFVKYIAEFYTIRDYKKINDIISTGFVFFLIFGILIVLAACFSVNSLIRFFNIPDKLYFETKFVFLLGVIIFAINNIVNIFSAIQVGLQRMDISNKINILLSLPLISGTVFFLEKGYGLTGLVINQSIILIITTFTNIIIAYKIFPYLQIKISYFNTRTFKQMFNFGIKVQITRLESIFLFETDKLLISHFLNVGLVSLYTIGASVVNKMRSIPIMLCSAVLPAASEISALQDKKALQELYLRGTKYVSVVGIPLLVFIFITAPLVILVWIGEIYTESVQVIRILAPSYLINILTGVSSAMIVGMGKPEVLMKSSIAQFILNLVLSVILVIKIGFVGVVIATLISFSTISLWFMTMFHKEIQMPILSFVKNILTIPGMAAFISGIILYLLNIHIYRIFLPSNRITGFYILGIDTILFFVLYGYIILKYKVLDKDDLQIAKNIFTKLGGIADV